MTTITITYPKWIGVICKGFFIVVTLVAILPFLVAEWLANLHIEFKERT